MARNTRKSGGNKSAASKSAAKSGDASGGNGGARDNSVRTRTATDAERQPGASIEVGKATGTAPLSGDDALAAISGVTPDDSPAPDPSPADAPAKGDDAPADAPKGKRAAAYAAAAAERAKNEPPKKSAAKKPGRKVARYGEEIMAWMPAAVARSRHISGQKPGADGDETLAYPGPKQHIAIRETVTALLAAGTVLKDGALVVPDGATPRDVTPENVMSLTGCKTMKGLTEIATWSADKSALAPMRPLSNATGAASGVNGKTDGWAIGRYLASALVAWVEEMKAAAKAEKDAEKNAAKSDAPKVPAAA